MIAAWTRAIELVEVVRDRVGNAVVTSFCRNAVSASLCSVMVICA